MLHIFLNLIVFPNFANLGLKSMHRRLLASTAILRFNLFQESKTAVIQALLSINIHFFIRKFMLDYKYRS